MNTLTTKELETKQQIENLERRILTHLNDFSGEVGDFHYFIKDAIEMKLHAFMSNDYPFKKPNTEEFSSIMHNIEMLRETFEAMQEIQYLESELGKEKQV